MNGTPAIVVFLIAEAVSLFCAGYDYWSDVLLTPFLFPTIAAQRDAERRSFWYTVLCCTVASAALGLVTLFNWWG